MSLSKVEFSKALSTLEESLNLYHLAKDGSPEKKAFRDACIQRFEYCIELSWKLSMKLLGSATGAAKPALREMARNGLIDDPSRWISFIEARNNTSHSYDEQIAMKVFAEIEAFVPLAKKLESLLSAL